MAKLGVIHKPRDLPMTTTVCTNCGQWLDHEEAIEGAERPDCYPKSQEAWEAWMFGEASADDIEWLYYCPQCHVDLSDKPGRDVLIIYADTYPEIERLLEKKSHLEKLTRQYEKNLHMCQEQLAKLDPTVPQVTLRNLIDFEQERIQACEQKLHIVKEEIQNELASL
jgi:hypothetical protein